MRGQRPGRARRLVVHNRWMSRGRLWHNTARGRPDAFGGHPAHGILTDRGARRLLGGYASPRVARLPVSRGRALAALAAMGLLAVPALAVLQRARSEPPTSAARS